MSATNGTCKLKKTRNVVKFDSLDSKIQNILREAVEARNFSYSPYSKFKVGACVETEDGTLYRGCNIENSSYTVGTCAERCAFHKAISEGKIKFKTVVVIAEQERSFTTPCGACRQFMGEFGDMKIYISKPKLDEVFVTSVRELLPHAFQTNDDFTF